MKQIDSVRIPAGFLGVEELKKALNRGLPGKASYTDLRMQEIMRNLRKVLKEEVDG